MIAELGAKSEAECNDIRRRLAGLLNEEQRKIPHLKTYAELVDFCREFQKLSGLDRPIGITVDSEITEEELEILRGYEYPEEFMDWMAQYGDHYLWLEAVRMLPIESVIEELEEEDLLTQNNYLFITNDPGGAPFVYDLNDPKRPIYGVRGMYTDSDPEAIEELYSETFGFWFDEEADKWVNEQNLDPKLVLDEDGEFNPQSPYIRDYLKKQLGSPVAASFLEFLLLKLNEGFDNIRSRYELNGLE